jgi:esterase/lipase superfamily enzyme
MILNDVRFLELVQENVDEIRTVLADRWDEFARELSPFLNALAETKDVEEAARLIDEIIKLAATTPAKGIVNRFVSSSIGEVEETTRSLKLSEVQRSVLLKDAPFELATAASSLREWVTPSKQHKYVAVPVFFATDRSHSGDHNPARYFGGQRAERLSYGIAQISIPDKHEKGYIEGSWLKRFSINPAKHVAILGVLDCLSQEFPERVGKALENFDHPQILIFVHGFCTTFAEAARVAAQISFDLNFSVLPILYTWPSKGHLLAYMRDEATAEATRENFLKVIALLSEVEQRPSKHLLAHSMGNRIIFQALQHLTGRLFGQIILAAPDEDADALQKQMHRFVGRAERNTLYASSRDYALRLSELIHGSRRAGEVRPVEGVDTIDATAVKIDKLGHSYYQNQRLLLSDMYLLLNGGTPPNRRPDIRRVSQGDHWEFRA